jgi:hypothetical protein
LLFDWLAFTGELQHCFFLFFLSFFFFFFFISFFLSFSFVGKA